MTQSEIFQKEIEAESIVTRKMLALVPDDNLDWKPHPKSMSIRQLATHIAELPGWVGIALNSSELDFATAPYAPVEITGSESLLKILDTNLEDARKNLLSTNEAALQEPWTLRNGDRIFSTTPKGDVIRMSISQTTHHRAQLGVFLRLLNIAIPGSYGPSADEGSFM